MNRYLKKTDTPFTKGRWYRLFIESTGSTIKITDKDIPEASISGTHVQFPHDLAIIDTMIDIHNVEFDSGTSSYNDSITLLSNGAKYLTMPAAKSWDYAHIYVYGYRTGE